MLTLPEPSPTTAAVAAAAGFFLLVTHMLGDLPVQRDADALGKGTPTDDQLAAGAHPWTGWSHLTRHCLTYVLTQAFGLLIVSLVAPLTLSGAAAALVAAALTAERIRATALLGRPAPTTRL